jgi:hypothetical protein
MLQRSSLSKTSTIWKREICHPETVRWARLMGAKNTSQS